MNIVSVVAIICICIEVWHLLYYNWLYAKYFKRPETIIKWAESYGKLHKYFVEFSDYYINNLDLQYHIGQNMSDTMLKVIDVLQKVGGERSGRSKILSMCSMKSLGLFLLQQFIEITYWILTFIWLWILPGYAGIPVSIILIVLSEMQKRFNPEKKPLWLNIDSVFCIALFIVIAYWF